MNYLETKEGQEALKEGLDLICQGLKLLKLPPHEFGNYLMESSSQDQKILGLHGRIVTEDDLLKLDYNAYKGFLLQVEHMARQLIKTKI